MVRRGSTTHIMKMVRKCSPRHTDHDGNGTNTPISIHRAALTTGRRLPELRRDAFFEIARGHSRHRRGLGLRARELELCPACAAPKPSTCRLLLLIRCPHLASSTPTARPDRSAIEDDSEALKNASERAEFYRRAAIDGLRGPVRADKKWKELNYEPVTYRRRRRSPKSTLPPVSWLARSAATSIIYRWTHGRYRELQDLFPDNFVREVRLGQRHEVLALRVGGADENSLVHAPLPPPVSGG